MHDLAYMSTTEIHLISQDTRYSRTGVADPMQGPSWLCACVIKLNLFAFVNCNIMIACNYTVIVYLCVCEIIIVRLLEPLTMLNLARLHLVTRDTKYLTMYPRTRCGSAGLT